MCKSTVKLNKQVLQTPNLEKKNDSTETLSHCNVMVTSVSKDTDIGNTLKVHIDTKK